MNPNDVGIPEGTTLTLDDLKNYASASNMVIERRFFLNQYVYLSGNNITFRQCKFYFNLSDEHIPWILSASGDNIVFDQIEVSANTSALPPRIDYFVWGLETLGTNFTLTNSLIRDVTSGVARDRVGLSPPLYGV